MPDLLLPLPTQPASQQQVCTVMVDLVGSTALAHQLPLDHYAALMAEFVQVLILSFEARGGQVLQHQGDAVLALWPAELTGQAVLAALESHDRAPRLALAAMLGVSLQVRAGAACGAVVTGPVGGQLSAYGLPVNLARRLCDAARPTETLVCPATQHCCQDALSQLQFGERPDLPHLPGFAADSAAFTVHHRAARASEQMKVS